MGSSRHSRPHSVSTGLTQEEYEAMQAYLAEDQANENKYGGEMAPFLRDVLRAKLKGLGYKVGREPHGRGGYHRYDVPLIRKRVGEWEAALENLTPGSVAHKRRAKELKILKRALEKLEAPEYKELTNPQRDIAAFAYLLD